MTDSNMWFAWFPVRTKCGKVAWLRFVARRWNFDMNTWCDASGYSGADGGWEYFLD